jgi:hypothetical protein
MGFKGNLHGHLAFERCPKLVAAPDGTPARRPPDGRTGSLRCGTDFASRSDCAYCARAKVTEMFTGMISRPSILVLVGLTFAVGAGWGAYELRRERAADAADAAPNATEARSG